jgi:hypothetical protein
MARTTTLTISTTYYLGQRTPDANGADMTGECRTRGIVVEFLAE